MAHMDVGRTLVLPLEWRRVCGELLELQQGCERLWKFQSISVISLETPQGKSAHLSWKGQPPGFSQVAAGALDL